MNHETFQELLDEVHGQLRQLTATKGEEYKVGDDDQLANFNRLGAQLQLPREKILWVHLTKHMDAIQSYIRTGATKSETIESRIQDAVLYLILLLAMVREAPVAGGPKFVLAAQYSMDKHPFNYGMGLGSESHPFCRVEFDGVACGRLLGHATHSV